MRLRMPTIPRIGITSFDEVHGTHDTSRFEDAEDGAVPLERPHAPNCFDARKLIRKESSEDRYADLSSSNDGEKTPKRFSSTDSDRNGETVPLVAAARETKRFNETTSASKKSDHLGLEDTANMNTKRELGMMGILKNWFMFTSKKDGTNAQTIGNGNGISLNESDSPFVSNPTPDLSTTSLASAHESFNKTGKATHNSRESKSKNVGLLSGIQTVFIEAYYLVLLVISSVCHFLMSIVASPFRFIKKRNMTVSRRSELNNTEQESGTKKKTSMNGAIEDSGPGSSHSVEREELVVEHKEQTIEHEELVVEREGAILISGTSSSSGNRSEEEESGSTTAQSEKANVSDLIVNGAIGEQVRPSTDDGTGTNLEPVEEASDLHAAAIRSSSSETTNTEDSDEQLWQRIQKSGQWTEDAEQTIRRATSACQERLSPVSQENVMKMQQPHSFSNVLGSVQRDEVVSKKRENDIRAIRGTSTERPQALQYRKRNSSFEPQNSLDHPDDFYYRERGFISTERKRDSFTFQEPDISGPGRYRSELEPEEDQYLSPFSVQYHDPLAVPEIRRKLPLGKAVISDVKAVTDSLFRVFAKNKPEPDTRFTSPRSAHKTMALIADLMIKEFNCQVAVRRNGALKLRCEKHYSLNRLLRARVTFQQLDLFSCNVVIARSRADNFTVPTSDYVNFVAGLQHALLNTITGSERYQ